MPDALKDLSGSNLSKEKHFDQIAFHDPKDQLKTSCGGVFDFQTVIYGAEEAEKYRDAMRRSAPEKFNKVSGSTKATATFYRTWRTFQLSDHLPLWVELKTDFANNYLGSVLKGKKAGPAAKAARKAAEASSPVQTPPPIANAAPAEAPRTRTRRRGLTKSDR